jgi:hypothetical protein
MSSSDAPEEEFYDASFYQTLHTSPLIIEGINVNYSLAISKPRDLIRFAKPYTWNRPINEEHVKQITNDLKEMSTPFLIGTFKVILNSKTGEFMIYDGQHRLKAYKNVLEEDPEHDCDIPTTLEIYSFLCEDGIEKSPVALKLFDLANKTHTFDKIVDKINPYIQDITNAFATDSFFKSNITESNYRPKIAKFWVYQKLLENFNPKIKPSISEIINLFKRKNNQISLKPIKELTGSVKSTPQYDKARKSNFFLNLTNYPFEKSVKEIVIELNK